MRDDKDNGIPREMLKESSKETSKGETKEVKRSPVDKMIFDLKAYIAENGAKLGNGTTAKAIIRERIMFLEFLETEVKKK